MAEFKTPSGLTYVIEPKSPKDAKKAEALAKLLEYMLTNHNMSSTIESPAKDDK